MRYFNILRGKQNQISTENQYKKLSYSQCGEDLIMKHIFDGLGIKTPSFIDIGAHHPYYMNNTALFVENGSRGINIEPDPVLFSQFPLHRKSDINLNIGISDKEDVQDFYIISTPTLNTFSKETAEEYERDGRHRIIAKKKIKTNSISNIITQYSYGKFPDLLSLDAEGVDELIIHSIDFEQNCPTVICIETITFSESGNGQKNQEIINFIESKGYLYYADTNINSIFVLKNKWSK